MLNNKLFRLGLTMRTGVCILALVGAVAMITSQVASQDKDSPPAGDKQPSPQEVAKVEQEMMKLWQDLSTPGEHHKHLEHFVGTWDTVVRIWMGEPGAPPSESKGTAEIRWILDGRFLLEEFRCEMVMPDATGKPKNLQFKGHGLTGYDNYKNRYVGSWADNMGTQLLMTKGDRDRSGKVFTYYGEMDEPMLGVQDRMVKLVVHVNSADKHVFEMYDLLAGEDYRIMEITYLRKK